MSHKKYQMFLVLNHQLRQCTAMTSKRIFNGAVCIRHQCFEVTLKFRLHKMLTLNLSLMEFCKSMLGGNCHLAMPWMSNTKGSCQSERNLNIY
jgi:hypothetical protein